MIRRAFACPIKQSHVPAPPSCTGNSCDWWDEREGIVENICDWSASWSDWDMNVECDCRGQFLFCVNRYQTKILTNQPIHSPVTCHIPAVCHCQVAHASRRMRRRRPRHTARRTRVSTPTVMVGRVRHGRTPRVTRIMTFAIGNSAAMVRWQMNVIAQVRQTSALLSMGNRTYFPAVL